jgi:hypothetical protein
MQKRRADEWAIWRLAVSPLRRVTISGFPAGSGNDSTKGDLPMKEPLAPKERPILTAHEPHPSPGEARRGEGPRYVLGVRYYRRMKVDRVYPMSMTLNPVAGHLQGIKSHTPPVEIRPVLPGAQVTPTHYETETTGAIPPFYVTPLVRGKLAEARLEVYSRGRLVQEIPLRMKGTSQRLTWVLLLLTILVPLGLWYFTRHLNLSTASAASAPAPGPAAVSKAEAEPEEEDEGPKLSLEEKKMFMSKGVMQGRGAATPEEFFSNEAKGRSGGKAEKNAPPQEAKIASVTTPKPVGTVEQTTMHVLPDFHIGYKTETVPRADSEGNLTQVTTKQPFSVTGWIAARAQAGYDRLRELGDEIYLSFCVGFFFLALTLVSWEVHAARRSRRSGEPIALGA